MKGKGIVLVALVVFIIYLVYAIAVNNNALPQFLKVQVTIGYLRTCTDCGKILEDTRHDILVPTWDKEKYQVSYLAGLCETCGSRIVEVTHTYHCKYCGKAYRTVNEQYRRVEDKQDYDTTEGYCSETCYYADTAAKGAGQAGKAIWNWMEKAAKHANE
jgi:hypothetical protein